VWLPLAALFSLHPSIPADGMWRAGLALFVAAECRRQSGTLANDLADRADDEATGKARWVREVAPAAGIAATAATAAGGWCVLAFSGAPPLPLAIYLVALVSGLFYSLPPVRFKERGLAGLAAFAASGALVYVAVPSTWFGGAPVPIPWTLAATVALEKWVTLHFHYVVDYEPDRARHVGTYAVRAGVDRARRTLRWAAGAASLAMLAAFACLAAALPRQVLWAPGIGIIAAAAAAAFAAASRRRKRDGPRVARELPWHYLGLTFGLMRVTPLLLLGHLATQEGTMWILAAVAMLSLLAESAHAFRYRGLPGTWAARADP
jgi:4-hydroxybenzoate polyprenyltransferase